MLLALMSYNAGKLVKLLYGLYFCAYSYLIITLFNLVVNLHEMCYIYYRLVYYCQELY